MIIDRIFANLNLQKYIMKLFRSGFFHITSSEVLNKAVTFGYAILIVRIIPKANYGSYVYANNIFSMFMVLSGLGIATSVLQLASESSDNPIKRSSLIRFALRFGVITNICLASLMALVSIHVKFPIENSNKLLTLLAFLPILNIVKDLQKISLRVSFKNREYARSNVFDTLLLSGFAIIGALIFKEFGVIIGHYLSTITMLFYLRSLTGIPSVRFRVGIPPSEKKVVIKIAGISALNNGLSQVLSLLGTFILGWFVPNKESIASYKAATTIPFALTFIPSVLMIYAYPYFARNRMNKNWTKENFSRLFMLSGCFFLLISIIGVIFSKSIIHFVFGQNYADAVVPFRILISSFFVTSTFNIIPGNLLVTQRRLGYNLLVNIVGAVVNILSNVILIPMHGSLGASLAYFSSVLTTGILSASGYIYFIKKI